MFVDDFWQFNFGHLVDVGLLLVATAGYFVSRKGESRERREGMARAAVDREAALRTQTEMHAENKNRLATLARFHEEQLELNDKRDLQLNELTKQSAMMVEIAKGMDRRLQLIENRWK